MQPIPEKVTAIEALGPPKAINELRSSWARLASTGKFIPFLCGCCSMPKHHAEEGSSFQVDGAMW